MSEKIDLSQLLWKRTLKRHIIQLSCVSVFWAFTNLMVFIDYFRLSSKVEQKVKDMLIDYLLQIPIMLFLIAAIAFLLFQFPNRTFYKIFSFILIIIAVLQISPMFGSLDSAKVFGKEHEKWMKLKKKHYFWGTLTQKWSIVLWGFNNGMMGIIVGIISFKDPPPVAPPTQVRVVRRKSNSKQKTGDGDDDEDSSE